MSAYDLEQAVIRAGEDSIDGLDSLPAEFEEIVTKTFETGKIVEPPERTTEPPKKPKKARVKKPAVGVEEVADAPDAIEDNSLKGVPVAVKIEEAKVDRPVEAISATASAPKRKKSRARKRPIQEVDASSEDEAEYIPKKSRSRSVPFKEAVGPA
jgi:hypothetical protein